MNFTLEQQRVIDTRNSSILVSAAAGSGKTAVLVERIIQMITDELHPVDIDRLLIVTFTSAAAAQMRERISKAVSERLEKNPENEHLQRQTSLIHNAQITTIDSFCLFIIRNNFNEIGIDPGFRVADEGEIKLLESDVMGKLLEEAHTEPSERFLRFVECYSTGKSEKKIEEAILRLYHFSISNPFPEEWLLERLTDYQLESMEELTQKEWFHPARKYMETVLQECEIRLLKGLAIAGSVGGPMQYIGNLESDLALIQKMQKADTYDALYDLFTYATFTKLSAKKGDEVDPQLKEVVKAIRDEVKKNISDLKKHLFMISPEDTFADMAVCQEAVAELVSLTLAFKERLDAAKRDKNLIDFSDMEHFALEILLTKDEEGNIVPRGTALELQDYFEEIMVDEYQDSNEVQELLLKSISGEGKGRYNRFMVGDVKQSIYKFRLARPEIFMEKYDKYVINEEDTVEETESEMQQEQNYQPISQDALKNAITESLADLFGDEKPESGKVELSMQEPPKEIRIDLRKNFRSRQEVTEAVNFICAQIMKKQVGNVEYDQKAALYAAAAYPPPPAENPLLYQTELLIATQSPESEQMESNKAQQRSSSTGMQVKYSDKEKEAIMVASRIKELVGNFPVTDVATGETRLAKFSDIVLLFRATTGWDEDFRRILSERGIPVHVTSKEGYFETLEIQGIVNILRVLDNPLQDIPFFGVMKLPFFGFTEEEIAIIRCSVEQYLSKQENLEASQEAKKEQGLTEAFQEEKKGEGLTKVSQEEKKGEGLAEAFQEAAKEQGLTKAFDNESKDQSLIENVASSRRLFLYEQVKLYAQKLCNEGAESVISAKIKKLLDTINTYRAKVVYTPIKELIQDLLRTTGYEAYVGAMPAGDQRRANLALLLEKAGAFQNTSFYGLFHFIRYLETIQEQEVDFGEANILDENANVVRIMTIHKSKGLEFPICFVCGLAKQFNQMDMRQSILMDVALGVGVDYIDSDLRVKRKTLRKNVVAQHMKEDTRGEDLRVLYVALTRAKEKLILTGYLENLEKKLASNFYLTMENEEKLPYSVIMTASSYMDFILASLMRHRCMEDLLEEYGIGFTQHKLPFEEVPFQVVLWQESDSYTAQFQEQGKAAILEKDLANAGKFAKKELSSRLQERLEYQYPFAYLEGLTVKTTVSELKRAAYEETAAESAELVILPKESYIPRFASKYLAAENVEERQSGLTVDSTAMADRISAENVEARQSGLAVDSAAMADRISAESAQGSTIPAQQGIQYGTAVHKFMELLSFSKELLYCAENENADKYLYAAIQKERARWISEGSVLEEDLQCVSNKRIAGFLRTSLATRMIAAQEENVLFREQPFVLGIPAKKLKEQYPEDEMVLIQGVIDVFFYEDGEIVLADYKTDRVDSVQELIDRYHAQLDYYQMALEQITGVHVKERILYSFALQKVISV